MVNMTFLQTEQSDETIDRSAGLFIVLRELWRKKSVFYIVFAQKVYSRRESVCENCLHPGHDKCLQGSFRARKGSLLD